jgi:hypothetical protein
LPSQADLSFYDIFDIHKENSQLIKLFMPLANTQEKPSIAALTKFKKVSFELTREFFDVKEMWQQHWFSVLFDLAYLWMSFDAINRSTDLPANDANLGISNLPIELLGISLMLATFQAIATYKLTGESTSISWMLATLAYSLLEIKHYFSVFGQVRDDLHPEPAEDKPVTQSRFKQGLFGSCFKRRKKSVEEETTQLALSHSG